MRGAVSAAPRMHPSTTMRVGSKLRRIAPYVVILGASAYLYDLARHFQYVHVPGRIGPDAWPEIMLVLMMATCVYEIVRLAWSRNAVGEDQAPDPAAEAMAEEQEQALPVPTKEDYPYAPWIGIALTFGYLFAFQILGFFLASCGYLVALMILGRYRRIWAVVLLSLAVSLIFVLVFMKVVYVSLPLGYGPCMQVSLFVMRLLGIH